jgi:hypothetical protein
MMKSVAPVVLFLLLQACDNVTPQKKAAATSERIQPSRLGLHRFVLTRIGTDVAFDTQTSQICRTWDWLPAAGVQKSNPYAEVKPGQFAPTCLSLYQKFPSGVESGTPETTVPEAQ